MMMTMTSNDVDDGEEEEDEDAGLVLKPLLLSDHDADENLQNLNPV